MASHLALLFTSDFYSLPINMQQEVYREYYRLVYPMIYFILKDYQATEDVIQESFLRAIAKAYQLQDLGRLESWLKMVARNSSINFLRKFKRSRNELGVADVFNNIESSELIVSAPTEEEVETIMLKEAIMEYINVLKPEYRQLIEMRWNGNLSYKEMASALGTSENVVRQKLYRARESVKQKLQQDWGF